MLITMHDKEHAANRILGKNIDNIENKVVHPIKKCHFLEGKHFIVIDSKSDNNKPIWKDEKDSGTVLERY